MSGIKEIIKKYIEYDDEIKELNKQIKPLREQKNSMAEQIMTYIKENSKDPNSNLTVGPDVFKVVATNRKKINRDLLEETIKEKTCEETSEAILSVIIEEKSDFYLKRSLKK